ncbi:MAG: hypothetical protein K5899_06785 [Bacteroidaceae bacterium]|nr:hypothetical protein [Bacteroidaceae bacterium]
MKQPRQYQGSDASIIMDVGKKDIDTPDELLRSGMAQFSKWVEGEKHVTITINIQNNFGGY